MRAAAVFVAERRLAVVNDFPEPQIRRPNEVKLRILAVGVCGTDREIASFVYGTPPEGYDYLVLGHEALGEVVETGPEVGEQFRPGDLAIPLVRLPCPDATCDACSASRQDHCETGRYREHGIMRLHGFMTEFVVLDAGYLTPVPKALGNEAVLVEPMTIAEKAFIQADHIASRLPWKSQKRAAVVGAGPVGLLGAMALRLRGYEVAAYSLDLAPNPASRIVELVGGRYFSTRTTSAEQLASEAGPFDLVYEAAGAPTAAFEVLKSMGPNGIFVLTGVPGRHGGVEFDTHGVMLNMVMKNQCLLGTVNAGRDAFNLAVEDLAKIQTRWPGVLGEMVTGRFQLEDFANPVLTPRGIKNVVIP